MEIRLRDLLQKFILITVPKYRHVLAILGVGILRMMFLDVAAVCLVIKEEVWKVKHMAKKQAREKFPIDIWFPSSSLASRSEFIQSWTHFKDPSDAMADFKEKRWSSKRSERLLSLVFGVLGFFWGLAIVLEMVPGWGLDFDFESLDGFGKFFIAVLMGCIVGLFYIPATRNARAFWLGTDQIRSNLSIISCGWFGRMLLYGNYLLVVFTSTLWVGPFIELLVCDKSDGIKGLHSNGRNRYTEELIGRLGMLRSDFYKFRRLHASKVPDLDYSRAKVFLHNHYMFLVVLQFFAPATIALLLLGLSHIDVNLLADFKLPCNLLPSSALVKEMALFLAWWITFVWAIFTSVSLTLYRRGFLFVS
ncbi:uncharacterized protein [Coffea arabica]|uniref:Uncharacterized protein n=1 Tax=Coffea arabica TaxID=13443 RepID=A0A6P6T062_COFAR|nr:uncharacterized protein LOC113696485 [Coffea arabica]